MFSLKFRIPILIFLLGITVVLGIGIPKMKKENGIKSLLATDNQHYRFYEEMEDEFGASDQLVLGLTFRESVFKKQNLEILNELSLFFKNDKDINEDDVLSLSTIDYIDGKNEELIIEPLISNDKILKDDVLLIQEKVRDSDMIKGKIVSDDEKSTVIIVTVNSDVSFHEEILKGLITRTDNKINSIKSLYSNVDIYRSGMVSVKHATAEYLDRDLKVMFPIAIIIVMIILYFLFHSLIGMIIPLTVTLFSVIWTLGLKGWIGSPLTMAETTIPIMLIAIGCADGVHIINEFLYLKTNMNVKDALKKTMQNLTVPVILTSLTTSLGFLSLITAPGVSVKNMGIFLSFGVITAMIFSLLFIPALLSFKREKPQRTKQTSKIFYLTSIGEKIIKYKVLIVIMSLLFLALSIVGMKRVKVETDQIIFLKESDPLRVATAKIQKSLGGVNSIDIIVEGEEDIFKTPEALEFIQALQLYSNKLDTVGYTLSLVDYIKEIYYQFMEKDTNYKIVPKQKDIISNLIFLYEMGGGDKLEKIVNYNYSKAKVSIRLTNTTQESIERLVQELEEWLSINTPQELNYEFTNDYIRIIMGNLVTNGQIKSFISTLIAILVLLMIIFRSPISGVLTALPVIIAVCFNFAVMWLTGTTLNIGTSVIASVGMGVGIDYSIHFFQRYKNFYLKTNDNQSSIINALNDSFKPILSNALAVGTGFLALLFSNYYIIAGIGWITGLSMFTTAVCALFVLPAYLAIFEPLKNKKRN